MPLRIAVVAHGQHPVRDPYAGGLEAFTAQLVRGLRSRGHHVVLYAAEGTNPDIPDELVTFARSPLGIGARPAIRAEAPDPVDHQETRAYLAACADVCARELDVVANHTLQPTVLALSAAFDAPTVTTLHTPPLAPLRHAMALTDHRHVVTAVSAATAAAWDVGARVIRNGVDTATFRLGPGGPRAVWFGRLVPDKGADLAIAACRSVGVGLDLVGPVHDEAWFAAAVAPHLDDGIRHLGALDHAGTAAVVGSAVVALVTPRWDEPFGLVAAESMACGTPVVALGRGAVRDVVGASGVVVAPTGSDVADVAALAAVIGPAACLDRRAIAADAVRRHALTRMIDEYEQLYLDIATRHR